MEEITGKRESIGKITNVSVKWEGKKGTMEFWDSYPSFSPKGVKKFTATHPLTKVEVQESVSRWEEGGGLSFAE